MVEGSVDRLARRDVEAARIEPIDNGTFPHADPQKAKTWHEGAHAIANYRRRYGITDEVNPLGAQPRGASARAERARAQQSIQRVKRQLGRGTDRSAQRAATSAQHRAMRPPRVQASPDAGVEPSP